MPVRRSLRSWTGITRIVLASMKIPDTRSVVCSEVARKMVSAQCRFFVMPLFHEEFVNEKLLSVASASRGH